MSDAFSQRSKLSRQTLLFKLLETWEISKEKEQPRFFIVKKHEKLSREMLRPKDKQEAIVSYIMRKVTRGD